MEISGQSQIDALASAETSKSKNAASALENNSKGSPELKEAFNDFVGETFFSELIKAYRSTQQTSAYFNGGRAEEIFQGQFDQLMAEELSQSSADQIADPMFELFMLGRQG